MINIVVFASGKGSNLQALLNAVQEGQINGKIVGVISNTESAGSIEKAKDAEIPYAVISPNSAGTISDYNKNILDQLKFFEAELIVYTGFNASIPKSVLQHYKGRILNIHPSLKADLLKKGIYGLEAQKILLQNNDNVAGCTVYNVKNDDGTGEVLGQFTVDMNGIETAEQLYEKVRQSEFKLYPVIIRQFIETL